MRATAVDLSVVPTGPVAGRCADAVVRLSVVQRRLPA